MGYIPSNVQMLEILGFADTAFFAVAIMDSELSTPWILPVPLERVWAIWRLRTPSGSCQYETLNCEASSDIERGMRP